VEWVLPGSSGKAEEERWLEQHKHMWVNVKKNWRLSRQLHYSASLNFVDNSIIPETIFPPAITMLYAPYFPSAFLAKSCVLYKLPLLNLLLNVLMLYVYWHFHSVLSI
jgi:hypothetical protein